MSTQTRQSHRRQLLIVYLFIISMVVCAGSDPAGTGCSLFSQANAADTEATSGSRKVAGLVTQLQSKITAGGPFDRALYERVASALATADLQAAATQELVANATDFASGKVRASMFVAYLKDALAEVPKTTTKEPTGLAWLEEKAKGEDLWAKFFLARAHFYSAAKAQAQHTSERFEGLGFPQDSFQYWETYKQVMKDESFDGSYSEVVKLAQEGVHAKFPPLINLLGAMQFNGLGMPKDEAKGLSLFRQAADAGFPIAMTNLAGAYENGTGVAKDEAEAVRWIRKAAGLGNAPAMNNLGVRYAKGQGVAKDEAEAVRWHRKAAELGDASAMYNLGVRYAKGLGVGKDEAEAVRWYRKAADLGNADAIYEAGKAYARGTGVQKSVDEAVQWVRKAAELGQPDAANEMSVAYRNGYGVAKNDVEAVRWLRKAVELGNRDAMVDLGVAYVKGLWGVTKNEAEAIQWFRKAAELGRGDAAREVGLAYANGQGVARDEAEAVRWYRKAAELGNASAMYNLGVRYAKGLGVGKDEAEAVRWYRKAADLGKAVAMYNLGISYANGQGVAKDDVAAVQWYGKAAEGEHSAAMNRLGLAYLNGQGVAKDDGEAFKWFQKAAAAGDSNGMTGLGYMYGAGRGVGKNDAEAVRWYQKAAVLGESTAMSNLGVQYENGSGVTKDIATAMEWYQKAAGLGNENAKQAVQRLQAAASGTSGKPDQGGGAAQGWKSAQEWSDAYRNAKHITEAQFLEHLPSARLEVVIDPALAQHYSRAEMTDTFSQLVQGQGIRLDQQSPFTLRIAASLHSTTVVREWTSGFNSEREKHPVHSVLVDLQVIGRAAIYRNGEFYYRSIIPIHANAQIWNNEYRSVRETFGNEEWNQAIEFIFSRIRERKSRSQDSGDSQAILWASHDSGEMFRKYLKSLSSQGDDVNRVFSGISKVSSPSVDLSGKAGMFINEGNIKGQWIRSLPEARFEVEDSSQVAISQFVSCEKLTAHNQRLNQMLNLGVPYGVLLVTSDVKQKDVVLDLGGQLIRMDVLLWVSSEVKGSLWSEVESVLPNMVLTEIREFVKEARYRR